jgi:hypothetical protein
MRELASEPRGPGVRVGLPRERARVAASSATAAERPPHPAAGLPQRGRVGLDPGAHRAVAQGRRRVFVRSGLLFRSAPKSEPGSSAHRVTAGIDKVTVVTAFDGPARAIRCAQAIASSVRSIGLGVRTGVHVGECELHHEGRLQELRSALARASQRPQGPAKYSSLAPSATSSPVRPSSSKTEASTTSKAYLERSASTPPYPRAKRPSERRASTRKNRSPARSSSCWDGPVVLRAFLRSEPAVTAPSDVSLPESAHREVCQSF